MNLQQLLDQTPRLRAWASIGPVQRAELEEFAEAVLSSHATGVTADGYFVEPGNQVWVVSGTGKPRPATVQKTQALTNYELFGPVPVAHSWLDLQALKNYKKYNLWKQHIKLLTTIAWQWSHSEVAKKESLKPLKP